MDDLQLIVDFHADGERQGPGSHEETEKALKLSGIDLSEELKIADIGCGCGAQTLDLAKLTHGKVVAVDLFPEFLNEVKLKADEMGVSDRINTLQCSMENLPFEEESLDLIWSEGAIYNMGFQKGLQAWNKFLKPGGIIGVSEITWLKDKRPEELEEFWTGEYSEMYTEDVKREQMKQSGFELMGSFTISEKSWKNNYYAPILERIPDFLSRHQADENAKALVKESEDEMKRYNKYKDYYGYVFYIGRKI